MSDGRPYFSAEIETMPWEQIALLQAEKMRKQVRYVAERSPFYQQKFREAGIQPGDIRTLDDLARLPFTLTDEIRQSQADQPPLGSHLAARDEDVVRIYSSTGTTGRPTYVGLTERDRIIWAMVSGRGYFARGIRAEDVVVLGMSPSCFVGGLPAVDALTGIGCAIVPVETGASDRLITAIQHLGATVLLATPSYAVKLAEYCQEHFGIPASSLGIRLVSVDAEPGGGTPLIRRKIEESWGAQCREALGDTNALSIIWAECPEGNGMHLCAQEFVYPEIVDPETGARLELRNDLEGELVYSAIDREATPLLRFRTRDRVKVWTGPCACGRTSYRVRYIGRVDDVMVIRGVNVFPSAIRDVVAGFRPETSGEIQVLLAGPGPIVEPPVHVKVETGESRAGEARSLEHRLEEALWNKLVFRARVELVPARSLPRFEGAVRIVKLEAPVS